MITNFDKDQIKKAVVRSQHCQRNFDLDKEIPSDDLDVLIYAATNCPSKQNHAFYNVHVLTDKDLIAKVHELSTGTHAVSGDGEFIPTTNSQTLANSLFVLERREMNQMSSSAQFKHLSPEGDNAEVAVYERDLNVAVGIAAGYLNITASMMGYSTGCCQCFQGDKIRELLGLENNPVLLMGIGYKAEGVNRRKHATEDLTFPTRKKEEISVITR